MARAFTEEEKLEIKEKIGCIIFSVGERKFSPNAKFFAKKWLYNI